MRIAYLAGSGNVIGTYENWVKGLDDPTQVSMTFSGQFFDTCSSLKACAYVISSHKQAMVLRDNSFFIEHRPKSLLSKIKCLFYISDFIYTLGIILSVSSFKADFLVITGYSPFLFLYSMLLPSDSKIILSLHCVLWPKFERLGYLSQFFLKLNHSLFFNKCSSIFVTSEDIAIQLKELVSDVDLPVSYFLSTYRRDEFSEVIPPNSKRSSLRILFAGRIETNKGIYDLLEVARRLKYMGRQDIIFDICGVGSRFDDLLFQVRQLDMDQIFICHGYCNKTKMRKLFSLCHVVVVPTRTDFVEGLNQVVIEGVLSGRPVITSRVCPALFYVQEAAIEVPPNDIDAYLESILRLSDDYTLYKNLCFNTLLVKDQFVNPSNSWGYLLANTLLGLQEKSVR